MLAGFAQIEFTPPLGTLMPGNFQGYEAKTSNGGLFANAAAVTAEEVSVILLSLDMLELREPGVTKVRTRISEKTGVPADHILVAATHTHTGPAVDLPIFYCPPDLAVAAYTHERAIEAGIAAWNAREECTLGSARMEEKRYGFNRDILMQDGSVKTNAGYGREGAVGTAGGVDHAFHLMRFDGADGKPRAFFVNYANHPDCHGSHDNMFCADFPGYMRRAVQAECGADVKVLFFNGTAGDINFHDFIHRTNTFLTESDTILPETIGRGLAEDVLALHPTLTADVADPYVASVSSVYTAERRAKTPEHVAWAKAILADREKSSISDQAYAEEYMESDEELEDTIPLEVQTIRLWPWAIVGIPAEVFTATGEWIREGSPYENTLVFELANGCIGYIPTKIAIRGGAYEARVSKYNSCCHEDTAEKIAAHAVAQLKQMHEEEMRDMG